jgi:hypothetical protein
MCFALDCHTSLRSHVFFLELERCRRVRKAAGVKPFTWVSVSVLWISIYSMNHIAGSHLFPQCLLHGTSKMIQGRFRNTGCVEVICT